MLAYRGLPVIPRFDESDRRLRVYWASVHGTVERYERIWSSTEVDLLAALRDELRQGVTVNVTRTAEGIEVEARRR